MWQTVVFVFLTVTAQVAVGFWGGAGNFGGPLGAIDLTPDILVEAGAPNPAPVVTDPKDPPIVFKRVVPGVFDWIYDDSGTGADSDLSIWRPISTQSGYYALGDVAVSCHCRPEVSAIMVHERHSGSLAAPSGFTEIWNDRGSGGSHDVRILRMNPPEGFTCLGHVAVTGYSNSPNVNTFRCVKSDYVSTTGRYENIWKDHGSGAHRDVGLWGNRVSDADTYALDANTFTSIASHSTPSGSPPMLNGRHVINHQLVATTTLNRPITLFQVTDLQVIWNDAGSGADSDFGSWRARGASHTFSLGDHGRASHRQPPYGFVAKAHEDDALKAPHEFRKVWDDRGSGADWDGAFWRPLCDAGYRPLGDVVTRHHWPPPAVSVIRCVKVEYTLRGKWEYVWNDAGSGADSDVTVWKAVADGTGQGVNAISTIASHSGMDINPYVLNPASVNYILGKPATRYILSNINYQFDDRTVSTREPDTLFRTTLFNHGSTPQTATREISYTFEETYSWGNTAGLEIGVSTTVTAGVPDIASASVTTSVTASYSHEWGGSHTKTETDTISVQTTVQPHSQKDAIIIGSRYTADVPYVATLRKEYHDGTSDTLTNFEGVYHGVRVNEVKIVYEADIPITS